jgi:hypothetical protein
MMKLEDRSVAQGAILQSRIQNIASDSSIQKNIELFLSDIFEIKPVILIQEISKDHEKRYPK